MSYTKDLFVSLSIVRLELVEVASMLRAELLDSCPIVSWQEALDRLLGDVGADVLLIIAVLFLSSPAGLSRVGNDFRARLDVRGAVTLNPGRLSRYFFDGRYRYQVQKDGFSLVNRDLSHQSDVGKVPLLRLKGILCAPKIVVLFKAHALSYLYIVMVIEKRLYIRFFTRN